MPIQNTGENDLHELRGNDYGYNEGTICFSKWVNWSQGDGFSNNGWYSGLVAPISIVGLLIPYG